MGYVKQFSVSDKRLSEITKYKVACKNCGRKLVFYPMEHKDIKVCDWCGHTIYRTPQIEFREKLIRKKKEVE